ncbi:OTU family ubiquitin thioesterase [Patescibacteria group bacterium]|nr:OTU family ubiquitin thioesterase [Patescibacteria group bacterium]
MLEAELKEHKEFYKHAVDKPAESKPEKGDDEEFCYTEEDYKEFVFQAGQPREQLGFLHVFALANIIKRPIFVYASEKDMKDWGVHEVLLLTFHNLHFSKE